MAGFLTTFGVTVVAQLPSVDGLEGIISKPDAPQMVLVNLDPGSMENLRRIGHLPRQFHNISFFVLSQILDPNLLMEAMALGVREFVPLPINEQRFTAALERLASVNGLGKRAKIINVIPTMGGVGATTISCNLAASIGMGRKTALIDMDLVAAAAPAALTCGPSTRSPTSCSRPNVSIASCSITPWPFIKRLMCRSCRAPTCPKTRSGLTSPGWSACSTSSAECSIALSSTA